MDTSTALVALTAVLANIAGSGLVVKIVMSAMRENFRTTFLTRETAEDKFLTKEAAAKEFATREALDRVEASMEQSSRDMWSRIAEHVVGPLNTITQRLDTLYTALAERGLRIVHE